MKAQRMNSKALFSNLLSLLLILLLSTGSYVSAFELKEHSATYTAKIKKGVSIDGTAVRSLQKIDEHNWLYRFDVESFIADIKESVRLRTSTPQLGDSEINTEARPSRNQSQLKIQPLSYHYVLSAFLMPDRKREVSFNWEQKTANSGIKKDKWTLSNLPDNSYDPLSYQLQLLIDVHSGLKEMDYQLAKKGKLRESTFVVLGSEVIETRFGKLNSIIAKKQRDDDAKRETFLWFSADYPLLLLKMTQKESDGEEYEIQLEKASIEGKPVNLSNHALN